MARPTARVLALLEVLQAGGTHRVRDLAERLGVDERTVRRYVEHLLELDVPVESVRGRGGGYRLGAGFRLPPLMLTDDEAVAVLVALSLLARSGPEVGDDAAARAEAKVRRALPPTLAARLTALEEAMVVSAGAASLGSFGSADAATLLVLAEAARARRLVGFAYRSGAGRDSARALAPYGLVVHGGRWLVVGADRGSGEVRTFRVDRVVLPRLLAEPFESRTGSTRRRTSCGGSRALRAGTGSSCARRPPWRTPGRACPRRWRSSPRPSPGGCGWSCRPSRSTGCRRC